MNRWIQTSLGKIIRLNYGKALPKKKRVLGEIPVYGSNGIIGWHNQALVKEKGIIVGRKGTVGAVHLSLSPFFPIDTSYFIKKQDTNLDFNFLYYLLLHADLSRLVSDLVPGLNRDLAYAQIVAVPEEEKEQKIIAGVLSLVQNAIAQQEKAIALTTELKKALMQKLFTEGTRNEPQKQTEIGLIPESWNLIKCSELCEKITVGVVVKPASYYVDYGIPAFRSFNVQEDRLVTDKLVYFSSKDNEGKLAKSKIYTGDVLIIRTGYPGISCVVPQEYDGANCIDLVIARPKNIVSSHFLSRFFNSSGGKIQALSAKHGLAQQHLNVGAVKNVLVPVPSNLEEQDKVVEYLEYIDRKIEIYENKLFLIKDFFQTLLHQLMTAKIRVSELNLDSLNLDIEE